MSTSDDLEKRLKKEPKRKIAFVESAPARPSQQLIQEKIQHYGSISHEWIGAIKQARYEFVNLVADKEALIDRRGGAYHFWIKLEQLRRTNEDKMKELSDALQMFNMAHEWYEILVAADEAGELERLEFLQKISKLTSSLRSQEMMMKKNFKVLFKEEQEVSVQAQTEMKMVIAAEDETLFQMRNSLQDLKDEVRKYRDELRASIVRLEDKLERSTSKIVQAEQKSQDTTTSTMAKLTENITKIQQNICNLEAMMNNHSRQTADTRISPFQSRATSKQNKKMRAERNLQQCERELSKLEESLCVNWIRYRHFGNRNMKESESNMLCVYCKRRGEHYSDACPWTRTVRERIQVLEDEQRCRACVEPGPRTMNCTRRIQCFYCRFSNDPQSRDMDHHSSICTRPEEQIRRKERKAEQEKRITRLRDELKELDDDEAADN
ncbi:hypothetical protein NECAME_11792 [Necator americanus]|uniref:Zinc knuckle n=1 Tax=Necator americanus TaxID=51031 RepID=W2T3Z8_NECAM|nr:hypothetical protein NECAME_11792 [Necator americanus]ETN76254.1 hypothetical protein NECAME_11792 [Necator americanus]